MKINKSLMISNTMEIYEKYLGITQKLHPKLSHKMILLTIFLIGQLLTMNRTPTTHKTNENKFIYNYAHNIKPTQPNISSFCLGPCRKC